MMITLTIEKEPTVANLTVTDSFLILHLADRRTLTIPLDWYPRLLHATSQERANWQLLGDGYAIEWPDLDEYIGIEGLLAGRKSGESHASFQTWLATR